MTTKTRVSNRLIHEKSPYLLQHAYNPVNWFPWGEEAFEQARKNDQPIFLSIGYSTCHWCHVMERESFEDQEVADVLNRDYVAIKVDREERPDIDTIYMDVCQAMTGHGGWPLTIIMTPDKKPFFAATYLPKNSRQGMSGLVQLLPQINKVWVEQRDKVYKSVDSISEFVGSLEHKTDAAFISTDIFGRAFEQYSSIFDETYGGFADAPKFPGPHNLYFLLRYFDLKGEDRALEMVEKTLESMYRGGIYDHIGFGFARYSTDRHWLVPHFEKMLYDNALLAIAYLEVYQLTGREMYARIAREIFTYVLRDMTSPEGAFYSAEDADSEGIEGKFYVWTVDEILSVLGEGEGEYFCNIYDVKPAGNFEGKNIPNLINKLIDENERQRLESLREKLFAYRESRVHPYKDDKILTSWNGMMIAALAAGARILKDDNYLTAAEKAASFVLSKLRREDGRLLARYRDGEAMYPAYALDYGCMIWALTELYQAGFNSQYLYTAVEFNQELIHHFWDEENGGVYFYGKDGEQLLTRPKEIYDGAIPSSNSLAIFNFFRLSRLTADVSLEEKAERSLKLFSGKITQNPAAYSFALIAALYYFYPGQEIVIVGDKSGPESKSFIDRIHRAFMPRTLVIFKSETDNDIINRIPYIKDMEMIDNKATVYLCDDNSCQAPINTIQSLDTHLSKHIW